MDIKAAIFQVSFSPSRETSIFQVSISQVYFKTSETFSPSSETREKRVRKSRLPLMAAAQVDQIF